MPIINQNMRQVIFFQKAVAVFVSAAVLSACPVKIPEAEAAISLPISAKSVVLLDHQTNRIVFSKTPYSRRAPASTTKILTAIVVLERLSLGRIVTVPKFVESVEPTKINLRQGEKFYVRDLIRAMMISSANDAAEVLAGETAGSRKEFAKLMNQKAKSLGCRKSQFVNASGLPAKGQYSTAYDLALIMKAAQESPFIVKTMKTKRLTIRSLAGRRVYLKNHNKMLWRDKREIIGKTGWTQKARHCFVGQIMVYGKKVFVSMLGSHRLWKDLKTLVDYEFGTALLKIRQNKKIWSMNATRRIQRALRNAGYSPGPIDGVFGAKTVKAVELFQSARKLQVDGIVGPKTWSVLERYL